MVSRGGVRLGDFSKFYFLGSLPLRIPGQLSSARFPDILDILFEFLGTSHPPIASARIHLVSLELPDRDGLTCTRTDLLALKLFEASI